VQKRKREQADGHHAGTRADQPLLDSSALKVLYRRRLCLSPREIGALKIQASTYLFVGQFRTLSGKSAGMLKREGGRSLKGSSAEYPTRLTPFS
jgi:hypothetical protein